MKRSPIKKKSSLRRIKQKIDLILREQVFDRDGRRCQKCNSTKRLTAHHVKPKGKYASLRFELLNLLTLCPACHLYWAHLDPTDFTEWFEAKFPGRIEQLKILDKIAPKVHAQSLLEEMSK